MSDTERNNWDKMLHEAILEKVKSGAFEENVLTVKAGRQVSGLRTADTSYRTFAIKGGDEFFLTDLYPSKRNQSTMIWVFTPVSSEPYTQVEAKNHTEAMDMFNDNLERIISDAFGWTECDTWDDLKKCFKKQKKEEERLEKEAAEKEEREKNSRMAEGDPLWGIF
jgi:hypothetical protein